MAKNYYEEMNKSYIIPSQVFISNADPIDPRLVCDNITDFQGITDEGLDIKYEGLTTYEKDSKEIKLFDGTYWKTLGFELTKEQTDLIEKVKVLDSQDLIRMLTRAEYDALTTYDEKTLYVVTDETDPTLYLLATYLNDGLLSKTDFSKLQEISERATRVASSLVNGNIIVDGIETAVYKSPIKTAYIFYDENSTSWKFTDTKGSDYSATLGVPTWSTNGIVFPVGTLMDTVEYKSFSHKFVNVSSRSYRCEFNPAEKKLMFFDAQGVLISIPDKNMATLVTFGIKVPTQRKEVPLEYQKRRGESLDV